MSITHGLGSQAHNNRSFTAKNVDKNRVDQDEILLDLNIPKTYDVLFGPAQEKYNSTHRPSQQIKNYYEHIQHSRQEQTYYEIIVQLGDKDNPPELNDIARSVLRQFFYEFQSRYASCIYACGGYIHNDESTPHLHIDYIPVCHNQTRGLETRNSHTGAMKEMGYVGANGRGDYKLWYVDLNEDLERIAYQYDIERVDMHQAGDKHYDRQEWQQYKEDLAELKQEVKSKRDEVKKLDDEIKEKTIVKDGFDKALTKTLQNAEKELEEKQTEVLQLEAKKTGKFVVETKNLKDEIKTLKNQITNLKEDKNEAEKELHQVVQEKAEEERKPPEAKSVMIVFKSFFHMVYDFLTQQGKSKFKKFIDINNEEEFYKEADKEWQYTINEKAKQRQQQQREQEIDRQVKSEMKEYMKHINREPSHGYYNDRDKDIMDD